MAPVNSNAVIGNEQEAMLSRSETFGNSMMDVLALEKLPPGVLALILSKTTPKDVGVLSNVSRAFNEAACDNLVWKAFLAPGVNEMVRMIPGEPLSYGSLKELYLRLGNHHLLGDGNEGFWIERATGGVCRTFSAKSKALVVMGMGPPVDNSWWRWISQDGSRFGEVAKLQSICWLEVKGEINTELAPGEYTLSWVMKIDPEDNYGMDVRVNFRTTDTLTGSEERRKFEIGRKKHWRHRFNPGYDADWFDPWTYYNVKHFTVERECNIDAAEGMGAVRLNFDLREVEAGHWKRGLLVDGVVIRAGKHALQATFEEDFDPEVYEYHHRTGSWHRRFHDADGLML